MEKPIRFFKIVLEYVIQEGKLDLPKKFVRKYGSALTSPATLTVPSSGSVWTVELLKANGKVWFAKGWEQFASHYSLAYGHLLVFRKLGPSLFQVLIFDKTAIEIEYPHVRIGASNPKSACEIHEIETGDSEDDRPISRKEKNKSNSLCPPPGKKMRIGSTSKAPDASPSRSLRAPIPSPHGTNRQERPSCLRGSSAPEQSKHRACSPKNPFFKITV